MATTGSFNYVNPAAAPAARGKTGQGSYNVLGRIVEKYAAQLPPHLRSVLSRMETDGESSGEIGPSRFAELGEALEAIPAARRDMQAILKMRESMRSGFVTVVDGVTVHNGRRDNGEGSLARRSFQLMPQPSMVGDWTNDAEVRARYYPALERLCKEVSGAAITVCTSHLYRSSARQGPFSKLSSASMTPIMAVHNDFVDDYKDTLVQLMQLEEGGQPNLDPQDFGAIKALRAQGFDSKALEACRLVVFNAWRNVGDEPVQRNPLALLDPRSISRDDLIPQYPFANADTGVKGLGVFNCLASDKHRFVFFPRMTKDEVLLLKTYDSDASPFIPPMHTSFDDPSTPDDAPPRTSIDARILCIIPRGQPAKL